MNWSVQRILPSDTSIAADFAGELADAMTCRDWPAHDIFRVQLAFDEAMVNAIRHGNRYDPTKTVGVEIDCNDESIRIRIADQGPGFNPLAVPDPRTDELLEMPGGRGVLLIQELMSRVEYNERGNEITMIKIKGDDPCDDDESNGDE